MNDKAPLSGTLTTIFFFGQVMSKRFNIGNVSNVARRNFTVGVNSALTIVDPT